jgi:hypothetical protein
MVARREGLNAAEARARAAPREHRVSIEPCTARRYLREGHASLECNARLLGKYPDGSDVADRSDDGIKERADLGRFAREVMREVVAATRVRLIAVRELAAAPITAPQGRPAQDKARVGSAR